MIKLGRLRTADNAPEVRGVFERTVVQEQSFIH
jgi:hypothetical protein